MLTIVTIQKHNSFSFTLHKQLCRLMGSVYSYTAIQCPLTVHDAYIIGVYNANELNISQGYTI